MWVPGEPENLLHAIQASNGRRLFESLSNEIIPQSKTTEVNQKTSALVTFKTFGMIRQEIDLSVTWLHFYNVHGIRFIIMQFFL